MMKVNKITSILFAKEIESCLKFWVERLGFEKTIEVPDGDKLAFAILQKGDVELMYQTYASAGNEEKVAPVVGKGPSFLYVEVENLDEVIPALDGAEIVMPVHTTFYGAKEVAVKDPVGHIITFAQQGVSS